VSTKKGTCGSQSLLTESPGMREDFLLHFVSADREPLDEFRVSNTSRHTNLYGAFPLDPMQRSVNNPWS
jgi:hypothetical protein